MAGAGYKLFSTGDVLSASDVNTYLQQQTVMVFASAAARTTALASVLAEGMVTYLKDTDVVEIYTGAAWVSLDDPNAIQNSIVDAKGDIITATADNTPARLAVGNNGETLVADSSTSTGLRYTAGNAQGNPVLNSAFQVWARGTSVSVPASTATTYTADRWLAYTGANQATTVSRQVTNDSTNLPSIQYCARVQRNSGQTGTSQNYFSNGFETINSLPYAGKTVTVSFYARAGANYSPTSSVLQVSLNTATGTDQPVTAYSTGVITAITSNATLTTTWQRFTATGSLSSTLNELGIFFSYTPTGTAGTNDYFEVTGVQLDIGSVALPFRTYAATIQGELAACQRYYVRFIGSDANDILGTLGAGISTTQAVIPFVLPSQMRVTPTAIESSTVEITDLANEYAITVTLNGNSTPFLGIASCAATGLTQYRPYFARNDNNAAGYVAFTAEL
jgi:hypothetical protein